MSRDTGFTGIHAIIIILAVVALSMIGVTWLIYNYREMKLQEWVLREGQPPGDLEGRGTGNSGGTNQGGGGSGGQSGSGEVAGGEGGEVVEGED